MIILFSMVKEIKETTISPSLIGLDSDTNRLKETFFSQIEKKEISNQLNLPIKSVNPTGKIKQNYRFNQLKIILIAVMLTLGAVIFTAKNEIIIMRRIPKTIAANNSLLRIDNVISFTGTDTNLIHRTGNRYLIPVTSEPKTGISIALNKPLNLKQNSLSIYLKNIFSSVTIKAILRDADFRSNSLYPIVITVNTTANNSLVRAPIVLDNVVSQKINPAQIKNITLFFYSSQNKNLDWVLLDDITAESKYNKVKL